MVRVYVTSPENIFDPQRTSGSVTMWLHPFRGDSVNMTQQCKRAETKEQKLERHFEVTKLNPDETE